MIDFSKIKCTGCTACVSSCRYRVIRMGKDREGFPYPYIEDATKCVDCGLCEKVCPYLNPKAEEKNINETAVIAQNKEETIRKESASGGMFSAIAQAVLVKGGIVYGAAYDEEFKVHHIGVETIQDLWKLRNSKYIQSSLDNTFIEIKNHLKNDRYVCFSGTPCQVEGLVSFLQKPYEKLYLVDLTCHGIGSPLIWDRYLELARKYKPNHIYFRWKHYGYKYSTMSFFYGNKEVYYEDVETDKMLRAYFTNSCDRETCYDCRFKKRYRISDFTLWDCFQPRFFDKKYDDDKGTSSVLINSLKGKALFDEICKMDLIDYKSVSPSDLVYGNKELIKSVKKSDFRDDFLNDALLMNAEDLFDKYFPNSFQSKMRKVLRAVLLKTGLYNKVKYAVYKYRRSR